MKASAAVKAKYRKRQKKTLAGEVKKLARKIKMHPDNFKYITAATTTATSTLTLANPLTTLLNGCAQGTDEANTRVGDKLKFLHLEMNIQLFRSGTAANTPATYRILLVKESTALGSVIALAQLFHSSQPSPIDGRNVTTRNHKRFHVFYDKVFQLGAGTVSTATTAVYNNAVPSERMVKIRKKLNFISDYSRGNAGTVADIDTNSFYMIVTTDNVTANDTSVVYSYNLRFLDS